MSISEISNKVIPAGAKGYGLTIAEPATQWWSAAITPGLSKAYGSYVQLVAATSEDVLLWLVVVQPPYYYGTDIGAVSIATGAAASEVEVLSLPYQSERSNYSGTLAVYYSLPVPILIPSGTRIAARMAINAIGVTGTGTVTLGHIKASVVSSF